MKKILSCVGLMLLAMLLAACKGDKQIQGTWQATTSQEVTYEMVVTEDTIQIDGQTVDYKQNAIGFVNDVHYYTISIDDESKYYSFVFPDSKDEDVVFFVEVEDIDEPLQGEILYAMSQDTTPDYQEYIEKYNK